MAHPEDLHQDPNVGDFNVAEIEGGLIDDDHLLGLSNHLQVSWKNPALVLAEMGTLKCLSECPNHHLAMDKFREWQRNQLRWKRYHFNQCFIKRWGKRPPLVEGSLEGAPSDAFEFISCYRDLVVKEVFTKLDGVTKQNATLVCKAWAVDIREITLPPDFRRTLVNKVVMFVGQYYKALVKRGPDRNIYTIQYKCACQRWDEEIERIGRVDWALVEPSDDEFEGYLDHDELHEVVTNIPSENEV